MSQEIRPVPPRRSGCAVFFGVALIAIGSLLLAHNVLDSLGVPSFRILTQSLSLFAIYWPLIFIGWGVVKVLTRVTRPEHSRLSAAELVVMALVLIAGLSVTGAKRAMEELSIHVSLDDVAGIVGPEVLGPEYRFEQTETFDIGSAKALRVSNARGRIEATGWDETGVEVVVVTRIHGLTEAQAESQAKEIELEFDPSQNPPRLSVRSEEGVAVHTDLILKLPRLTALLVVNDRGSVRVAQMMAPVRVETSFGRIEASDLGSGIDAKTSSAGVDLRRITGDVTIRNRGGFAAAVDIDGDVVVETSNGPVRLTRISGSSTVETRQSSVEANALSGPIDIRARFSEVSVEQAKDNVTIATSNRPVFVHDVSGSLRVTTRNSNVNVRRIGADVTIDNQYRPVMVADVSGTTSVDAPHSAVDIEGARGPISVKSSHEDIRVVGVTSTLEIRATHAAVEVVAERIDGAVTLETTYGDVTLALPSDASATIVATTRDGEIESVFPETRPESPEDGRIQWLSSVGSGAYPVTISTIYADIRVTERR